MQNDFEKQVKQKMEELDLVPSAPVWSKIEEQIRQKKDKRKIIIWGSLLCLVMAGGIWWIAGIKEQQPVGKLISGKEDHTPASIKSTPTQNSVTIASSPATPANQEDAHISKGMVTIEKTGRSAEYNQPSSLIPAQGKTYASKNYDLSTTNNKRKAPGLNMSTGIVKQKITAIKNTELSNSRADDTNSVAEILETQPVPVTEQREALLTINILKQTKLNIAADEALYRKVVSDVPHNTKSNNDSRWQWGLTGALGYSGLNSGLNLFGKDSSANVSYSNYSPLPPLQNNGPASPERRCLSFAAGFIVKKELNSKWKISSGLGYQLFSNKISVGRTVYSSAYTTSFISQRGYINSDADRNIYFNKYQFINLPFELEMKLFKGKPLYAHTGMALQYMIYTNGLVYNNSWQVYYLDRTTFHKIQAISNMGLDYGTSILGHQLLIGPEVQYGFTKLQKNNEHHLFAVNLRAQFLLH